VGAEGCLRFVYSDGTQFLMDRPGMRVWASWPAPLTLEDAATYLIGPILGFILRLRGVACLHASAVVIGETAVALAGPAGAGKSTTAAAFARLGYPVLSDDIVALETQSRGVIAQPGYPRLNLWPAAVQALFGAPDALPLLTPNWDKRFLALKSDSFRFQEKPLPLAAIYLLRPQKEAERAATVRMLQPSESLLALTANTYANYLLDARLRALEFRQLGEILAKVSVREVQTSREGKKLPELCEAILSEFHSTVNASAASTASGKSRG
jgi:hypothetical protein